MKLETPEGSNGTVDEIGRRLEAMLETVQRDLYRLEGTVQALKQAAQVLKSMLRQIEDDQSAGKFPVEVSQHIRHYVERAHKTLLQLSSEVGGTESLQRGKVEALQIALEVVRGFRLESPVNRSEHEMPPQTQPLPKSAIYSGPPKSGL
jgi:flavin-binding protein dodecin